MEPEIAMSAALATGNTQVLRETDSPTGRRVQLLRERGTYAGAQPYYTVATFKPTGRPTAIRHTPFLTRAERLFELFLADVTDAADLALRPMLAFDAYRDRIQWPSPLS